MTLGTTEHSLLPPHGRVECSACFGGTATWRQSTLEMDGWLLGSNPMVWGAQNPRFLVLGFSKGVRQCTGFMASQHDDVAFCGFRDELTQVFQVLSLIENVDSVDAHLRADDPDLAFGSVLRCSVARIDSAIEKPFKSWDVIAASARKTGEDWIGACMRRFLAHRPSRLRVVILLSNNDSYTLPTRV